MTDTKKELLELMRLADDYAGPNPWDGSGEKRAALDNFARQLTDRITELEAQLEAVGAQAVNAKRLTQATRDITTVLRVEGMDLEIGSRKLLKEARDAIDAAIAKEAAK